MKTKIQTFADFIASDEGHQFRLSGMTIEQAKQDGWVIVQVPSRADAQPPELNTLDDSTEVALFESGQLRPCTASFVRFMFKELIERTTHGRYSVVDLTLALSEQQGQPLDFFVDAIRDGYAKGWLRFYFPDGSPAECGETPPDAPLGREYYLGLSNEYTTLDDVNYWLAQWGAQYLLEPYKAKTHGKKQLQQQELIMQTIRELGYDPQALPPRSSGKAGVKAEVKEQLKGNPLFASKSAFDTAWKELGLKS